jgi:CTP:phosphocholine cytidylyltransferase-like protein
MWQEYGIPCMDAMVYFQNKEFKSFVEVMDSDAVSEFHKYLYYHELMKRNIEPAIWDSLVKSNEVPCLPPEVAPRQAG